MKGKGTIVLTVGTLYLVKTSRCLRGSRRHVGVRLIAAGGRHSARGPGGHLI